MKLLTRYVLREFLIPLAYCLVGFIGIFVLFELSASFSRIMDSGMGFFTIVAYFAAFISPFFMYLAPASMMLATLYTMWNFCRHSEIIAMRASGVSLLAIVKPLVFVAALMACAVAWVNEVYVPRNAHWASKIKRDRFEAGSATNSEGIGFYYGRGNRVWMIDEIDKGGEHLKGVKITQDRESGVRSMTIAAERADYLDGEWWFTNPKVQHFDLTGQITATPCPELDALTFRVFPDFRERPDDILVQNRGAFTSVRAKNRGMRTHEGYTEERKRDLKYDIWAQALSPLACIIITLFAIPAGIASGRQSVFKGVVGAIMMYFLYYALVIGGMVAAKSGWFPPIPAAILPPVIFLGLGIRAFRRQR